MIDVAYLNGYQKEFSREVSELKYLITLINEIKMNFQFIKTNVETQCKVFKYWQERFNQVKTFLNDSSTINDDPSLF